MKRKIILTLAIVAMLTCIFAFSVNAEDTIVKSATNEYGTLTIFEEAIGNTGISQLKNDGKIARTVLYDSNNDCYYTVPTTYILTEAPKGTSGEMFNLSFTEISAKLGFTVSKSSIIRSEMPADIAYICNSDSESYNGCSNVIEIVVSDGLRIWDNQQRKVFASCSSLVSIDISKMVLTGTNNTYSMFEYCNNLTYVKLPNAYEVDGVAVNYATNYMFHGCYSLETIDNMGGLFKGVTTVAFKTFCNCYALKNVTLWNGLEAISDRAFSNCKSITSIIFPDTVKNIGANKATAFESCTSLKKIVLPSGPVTVDSYCFEKCTALTDVWMPTEASTFGAQVFGQIGVNAAVNFYFTTADNTVITVTNTTNNNDPFMTAITAKADARLIYNTPLSTKCTVFLGGHNDVESGIAYTEGFDKEGTLISTCTRCQSESGVACDPIVNITGYAVGERNGRISVSSGFTVNTDLVALYNKYNGVTLEIGILFAKSDDLADTPTSLENIKHFSDNGNTYATYNYIVTFPNADDENYHTYVSSEFVASAFIYDSTKYSFYSNNTADTTVNTLSSGFTTTNLEKIQAATQETVQPSESTEVACINEPVCAVPKSTDELFAKKNYYKYI